MQLAERLHQRVHEITNKLMPDEIPKTVPPWKNVGPRQKKIYIELAKWIEENFNEHDRQSTTAS